MVDGGAAADAPQQPRRRGGRAARGARRLRRLGQGGAEPRGAARDRRGAARARPRRDAARPERQAGRRLHDARGRAARADRELAARPEVGDVGRVPAARGRGADDVRPDDRGLVDLHRLAGDPAGDVPDVRGGRREALRLVGPARADDPHGRARRHGRRAAARRDDGGRGDPLHRGRSDADRAAARDALSRRGGGVARRRARAGARGGGRAAAALGRAARERRRPRAGAGGARRGVRPRHRPDGRTRSAQRLRAARLLGRGGGRAALVRSGRVPAARPRVDRPPRRGAARVRPARRLCFRLWQQPAG